MKNLHRKYGFSNEKGIFKTYKSTKIMKVLISEISFITCLTMGIVLIFMREESLDEMNFENVLHGDNIAIGFICIW